MSGAGERTIAEATPWLLIVICVALVTALAALVVILSHLGALSAANRDAAFDTCERGNVTRQVNVENFRKDIATFRSDIAFGIAIRESVAGFPPIANALSKPIHNFIDKHAAAIEGKRQTIQGYVEANAPVAVEPGSVIADCDEAVGS